MQRVAHAAGEQMEVLGVEGRAGDEAARGFLLAEPAGLLAEQRDDAIVRVVAQRRVQRDVLGRDDAVAVDDVEVLAVRRDAGLVDAVIAVAALAAVPGAQRIDRREAAVALRIAQPMEAGLAALPAEPRVVDGLGEGLLETSALHVEAVVVPRDAHGLRDRRENRLGLRDLAGLVERQAGERLLLVGAEDEAALVVFSDADPRALHWAGPPWRRPRP